MSVEHERHSILILDDEIYNAAWLIDFIQSLGYEPVIASTANEAYDLVTTNIFRAAIIDLNVPILSPLDTSAQSRGSVYMRYPGLFVAWSARQAGYRGRQVLVYSVHRDDEVTEENRRIGCTYILKGRPKELKEEIESVLSRDPTFGD